MTKLTTEMNFQAVQTKNYMLLAAKQFEDNIHNRYARQKSSWVEYIKGEKFVGGRENSYIVYLNPTAIRLKNNKIRVFPQWFIRCSIEQESERVPRNWYFIGNV